MAAAMAVAIFSYCSSNFLLSPALLINPHSIRTALHLVSLRTWKLASFTPLLYKLTSLAIALTISLAIVPAFPFEQLLYVYTVTPFASVLLKLSLWNDIK